MWRMMPYTQGARKMAYTLEEFCRDCRTHLGEDPGPPGRERVRRDLERLLRVPEFVHE